MRPFQSNFKALLYGACLVAVLYNCKTKDVDSLTPFTYTFKGFDNVKLPEVKATEPAAVSATQATVAPSVATAAVAGGLAGIKASGQIPAAVQQATDNIGKVVSDAKADQLIAAFTPAVLDNVAKGGTLPAALQAEVTAMANDPALKAYFPTFTLPTVDGKAVGGRAGVIVEAVAVAHAALDQDACKAAANSGFNTAMDALTKAKDAQVAQINSIYAQRSGATKADVAPCKSTATSSYNSQVSTLNAAKDKMLADLDDARSILSDKQYKLLKVLIYSSYSDTMSILDKVMKASEKACESISSSKDEKAARARDNDLSQINSEYNKAVAALTKAKDQAVAGCHNQGNGG